MNITTPALELRLQTKSQALFEYERASPEDKAQVAPEWLARVNSSQDSDPWVHGFKMVLRQDGTEVGRCGFTGPPDADGIVEIAYGVDEEFRGRGYATEAAAASIDAAFNSLGIKSIVATVYPDNKPSLRVLEKLGMRLESEVFGHWPMTTALLFRIHAEKWFHQRTARTLVDRAP